MTNLLNVGLADKLNCFNYQKWSPFPSFFNSNPQDRRKFMSFAMLLEKLNFVVDTFTSPSQLPTRLQGR